MFPGNDTSIPNIARLGCCQVPVNSNR